MSLRRTLELRAGPALVVLARLPRWVPFVLVLGCVVGGLLLHGVAAAVLLGVVLALLGLQLFFAWPALDPAGRVLRTVVLGLIVGAAVSRF
ncbi:MAG: hypothetical protein JWO22_1077 [Frankiales bacterium]|nr:hypothetical protein [Frankiales bacterium]